MEGLKQVIMTAFSFFNVRLTFGNFSFTILQASIAMMIMGIAIGAIGRLFEKY